MNARIEWQGKYVRIVAVEAEPTDDRNPFRHGNEEFIIEWERGRDMMGVQRWERLDVWSDQPTSTGIVRSVLAELVAALLNETEAVS